MPTDNEISNGRAAKQSSSAFLGFDAGNLAPWILVALIIYAAIRSTFQAATRPFWYDEVCTWVIVRQHGVSAMWSALSHGVDGQPLGYYLVERFAAVFTRNEEISFRLPSIVGFACLLMCVYAFARKRSGNLNAVVCAAIPFFTVLFDPFAVEARPYSLVIACLAFAVVCYQNAPSTSWMILMGLSLALAQTFHYYCVVSFFPFIAAETVWTLLNRRLRIWVWLAFCIGLLPLIIFWPVLSRFRAYYGAHFWAVPSLAGAEASYGWYFNSSTALGIDLAAVTALAVLIKLLYLIRKNKQSAPQASELFSQPILILGFLALPFVGFVFSQIAHGGMTPRYTLAALLAFPLAMAYVFPPVKHASFGIAAVIAILLAFALQEKGFWSSHSSHFVSPTDSVQELVASAGYPDLLVVISHPHDFLQLAHYAPPEWNKRFVCLLDPAEAVVYSGSDSADKELQVMREFIPLQAYDFQEFAALHNSFLLYSSNAGQGLDWWGAKLFRSGYALKMVAQKDYYHRVFLVTKKGDSP